MSLHRITYWKYFLMIAFVFPILTEKKFCSGRASRAPTAQVKELLVELAKNTTQGTPSMTIVATSKSKLAPLRVKLYPPNTCPLGMERELTTGVWSYLYSTAFRMLKVLVPSS